MSLNNQRAFIAVGEESQLYDKMKQHSEAAQSLNIPLYLLVYAEILPETNKSWCPDCVDADPYLDKLLNNVGGYLVTTYIRRDGYRQHIYRTDENLQLTSVPTLYKWENDRPTDRLVERDVCDINKLASFAGVTSEQLSGSN